MRRLKVSVGVLCLWIPATLIPLQAHQTLNQSEPSANNSSKWIQFKKLSNAADKAREENRNEDAIHLYRQALDLQPEWKQGLWYLGILLYEKEQYSEVRYLMRRFVVLEPDAGPGWALLGMSEFQTREYPRSLDHMQHARVLGLSDRKEMMQALYYYDAVLLTRSEQYDDAMTLFMSMKPGASAELLAEPIGLAALRYPLLPSEISPDRKELFRMAGQAALDQVDHQDDEAEKLLLDMTATYPNEPGVHFLYGIFLLGARPQEGIKELQRELEISPYNFTAKLRLADEYVREQQLDEAQRLAEEVIKVDPNYASGYLVLGEALVAKGDLQQGIAALENSRKLRPETVRTHWDLLHAYTSAGRTADAQQEKEEIAKLRGPEVQP